MSDNRILNSAPIPITIGNQQLIESTGKYGNKFIVRSIIQRAEAKNENQRVYPRRILEPVIKEYIDGPIKELRAYGELDHTDSEQVNFKNACICIREIYWQGNDVMGIIEVLNTPSGKIVQEVLKAGLSVGISSRGKGSVTQISEDLVEVDPDFTLICWDIVTAPSTQMAYLKPEVMNESTNLIKKETYSKINSTIGDILCMNLGYCECKLHK